MGNPADIMAPVSGKAYGSDGLTVINYVEITADVVALANAARTATVNSADQVNRFGGGVHVVLDVTAVAAGPAAPSIVLKIQGKDTASGEYYDILESAAVTTVSTNVYKVHPNLLAAANIAAGDMLPRTWRIRVEHANADSITYSVGVSSGR